jgi:N-acetylneuraminate synthase
MTKVNFYKKPITIAEIGINHNGNIKLAKKLIILAKKYRFDAVKFQKRDPDICVPDHHKKVMRETPWGYISYLNYKKKIEFEKKEFDYINKFCKQKKIKWFASAFDKRSQLFLKKYKMPYNKIASAMVTNIDFITFVAKEGKPTFISTGMTSMKDITKAVKVFRKFKCPFTLMHCISSYPADENKLNLNTILTLKKKFKCDVGYSGHEKSVSPSVFAYIAGATVIERHITIDRTLWGTDHAASLEENGIKNMMSLLEKVKIVFGNGKKIKTSEDKVLEKKFRYWL